MRLRMLRLISEVNVVELFPSLDYCTRPCPSAGKDLAGQVSLAIQPDRIGAFQALIPTQVSDLS